jgi:hypothetical protein
MTATSHPLPAIDCIWRTGDAVKITCEGRTVSGSVKLGSGNGRSLMLEFDAILGGCCGMMPVIWDEQTHSFHSIVNDLPVEVTLG